MPVSSPSQVPVQVPAAGPARSAPHWPTAIAVAALVAVLALGTTLRLADPLSSPVVPAEDPYTHMALVREHLRTGTLDPLNPGETVYPPGLHGFMAAVVVLTGSDLYDLTLYGPVVLGAIGILGVGILLWRTSGPVAGFVGALAIAVAPEAIFRTTMMSPTALDLAVLPFLFYALLRVLAGRLGWAGVALPMVAFLALSHPWLLAILCAAGLVFLVFAAVMPWPASRGAALSVWGASTCIALLGCGLGLALAMPTFGFVLPLPHGLELPALGAVVAALALVPLAAVTLARRRGWTRTTMQAAPWHWSIRAGASAVLAAGVTSTWLVANRLGMPAFVHLPHMVGWPIMALAFVGLVALPFLASPIANWSAALAVVTLPFVLFNPLHSDFLPHRTAVFLLFALALLAGVAAGAAARAASAAAIALRRRIGSPASTPSPVPRGPLARPKTRSVARPFLLATLPALFIALLLGGSVYAGTPDAYDGGWYRLYNSCELDAFRDIAAQANADPHQLVVTGDWQAKLVLAALTDDASRVWYAGDVFTSPERRDTLLAQMDHQGRSVVVVVDRHLPEETPDADTGFLAHAPWHDDGAWCANMGVPRPRVQAYSTGAAA